jgi:hypothetical protein
MHPVPQELIAAKTFHPQQVGATSVPAFFADAGDEVAQRFVEFFTAEHRNANTRAAYARAMRQFTLWTAGHGLQFDQLTPVHVAGYVEQLGHDMAAPRGLASMGGGAPLPQAVQPSGGGSLFDFLN